MPVPAAAIAERRLIDALLRANAVGPSSGTSLGDLRMIERRRLERLVALGVIREEGEGRYYLYAPALADRMRTRRRRLMVVLLVVVLLVLMAVLGIPAIESARVALG